MAVEYSTETITPEMALGYANALFENEYSRFKNINIEKASRYFNDMMNGMWIDSPINNCILFNEKGMLVDGVHRLLAIAKSGKPRNMFVGRIQKEHPKVVVDVHLEHDAEVREKLEDLEAKLKEAKSLAEDLAKVVESLALKIER